MSKRKRVNFACYITEIANGYLFEQQAYLSRDTSVYYATLEEAVKTAKTELTRLLLKNGRK